MKKGLILAGMVLVCSQPVQALETWDSPWEAGAPVVATYHQKQALAGRCVYVRNKAGRELTAGEVVVWDTATVTVVSATTASAAITPGQTLASEGGPHHLVATLGASVTGTIFVTGTDQHDRAQAVTTTWSSATTTVKVPGLWNSVSVLSATPSTSTTVTLTAYPFSAVRGNTDDDVSRWQLAGVLVHGADGPTDRSVADNEGCVIQPAGAALVQCTDTGVVPGDRVATDASGGAVDETVATDLSVLGVALEPCTTVGELIWVWLGQ